ncbi:hypothetical protein NC651_011828 [Populus alba x Populus x berolinensis]|nr:hypothetical protein NC651_011828 [Populus alba x Populus x berolinensis]
MVFKPEALIWKSMAADSTKENQERTGVPDDEHDSKNETRPVKKQAKIMLRKLLRDSKL